MDSGLVLRTPRNDGRAIAYGQSECVAKPSPHRHARAPSRASTSFSACWTTWMAGTSPAMTTRREMGAKHRSPYAIALGMTGRGCCSISWAASRANVSPHSRPSFRGAAGRARNPFCLMLRSPMDSGLVLCTPRNDGRAIAYGQSECVAKPSPHRHARAPSRASTSFSACWTTWMAGTSPAMTTRREMGAKHRSPYAIALGMTGRGCCSISWAASRANVSPRSRRSFRGARRASPESILPHDP